MKHAEVEGLENVMEYIVGKTTHKSFSLEGKGYPINVYDRLMQDSQDQYVLLTGRYYCGKEHIVRGYD